jgi:NAD(P)-dependent dehydrogenase (short-subunit alcohol dehydrogenase family)
MHGPMPDLFSLDGKTALVTGGGRGIGKMIARGLLQAGARVYISSRKEDELAATAEELGAYGPIGFVASDLSTEDGARQLGEWLAEQVDQLHVLVNNAGAAWGAPFEIFPDEGWTKVIDLNVKAVAHLTKFCLPLLRAASATSGGDPARVINVGSMYGIKVPHQGFTTYSYSASKAAVHMLTRHTARALAPDILVNAIAPGWVETQMMASTLEDRGDQITASVPLQRLGAPDDMAGIAVFLASRASSFITGAVIPVDGGVSTIT